MKRVLLMMMGGAVALLVGTTANAATEIEKAAAEFARPAASGVVAGTVTVESAGTDGGRPIHTAQVESAEYEVASPPPQREPGTTTQFLLLAVLGVGFLASALFVGLRRRPG